MLKSHFPDIDTAIKSYVANEILIEKSKDIEELIFFSSYTIKFDIFKKATQKLKKKVREKIPCTHDVWEKDALKMIETYHLDITYGSERYAYLMQALLKAQIKINEAVMAHFICLCKKAHSFEYLENRLERIYRLLFDDVSETLSKTSSSL